ncbi:MAG: hypothetical protein QXT63_01790 [Thermoplasmata archaeon]
MSGELVDPKDRRLGTTIPDRKKILLDKVLADPTESFQMEPTYEEKKSLSLTSLRKRNEVLEKRIAQHIRTSITNGWINGLRRGISNGCINGLINGNGFINGRSFINGSRFIYSEKHPKFVKPNRKAIVFLVFFIILVVGIVPYYVISNSNGIAIDGDFSDWQVQRKFSDSSDDETNQDINLVEFAYYRDADYFSFLVGVEGRIFSGSDGVDACIILLDLDAEVNTGYKIRGIGADAKIEIKGYGNAVSASKVSIFNNEWKEYDWNGF